MSRNQNQAKALIDAWFILLRYRWRFLVPTFVVTSLVLLGSLMLPRKYRGEAIFDRRTDVVLTEIMAATQLKAYDDPRASMSQQIAGGPAIDAVINEIKPYIESRRRTGGPYPDLETLRTDLNRKVIVRFDIATKDHERIRVSYTGEDPVFARLAVNLMVHNYIESARAQIDRTLSDAGTFFRHEVEQNLAQIEKLENEKLEYEIRHADLLPSNRFDLYDVQTEVEDHVAQLAQMREAAELRIKGLEESLQQTPETVQSFVKERNPELDRLHSKLADMERQYRQLVNVQKMTDRHPDLLDLRQQIVTAQQQIAALEPEIVTQKRFEKNPQRAELELLLTKAVGERESIRQQYDLAVRKLNNVNAKSADVFAVRSGYRKITRQIEQMQREVSFWEEKLRRVQMALTAETGNRGMQLEFVRPCPKLAMPVSPDLVQILITAIGLGLMAGAVSLLFAHRMDETAHDGEALAKSLDLRLLGTVSEIIGAQQRRVRWIKQVVIYPLNTAAMALALVVLVGVLYMSLKRPTLADELIQSPTQFMQKSLAEQPSR